MNSEFNYYSLRKSYYPLINIKKNILLDIKMFPVIFKKEIYTYIQLFNN